MRPIDFVSGLLKPVITMAVLIASLLVSPLPNGVGLQAQENFGSRTLFIDRLPKTLADAVVLRQYVAHLPRWLLLPA